MAQRRTNRLELSPPCCVRAEDFVPMTHTVCTRRQVHVIKLLYQNATSETSLWEIYCQKKNRTIFTAYTAGCPFFVRKYNDHLIIHYIINMSLYFRTEWYNFSWEYAVRNKPMENSRCCGRYPPITSRRKNRPC